MTSTRNSLLEELWSYHESLRRVGILSDDIYVVIFPVMGGPGGADPTDKAEIAIEARQNGRTALFGVGEVQDRAAFEKDWHAFAAIANEECNTNVEYYRQILERSAPFLNPVDFLVELLNRGLKIPKDTCVSRTDIQ